MPYCFKNGDGNSMSNKTVNIFLYINRYDYWGFKDNFKYFCKDFQCFYIPSKYLMSEIIF